MRLKTLKYFWHVFFYFSVTQVSSEAKGLNEAVAYPFFEKNVSFRPTIYMYNTYSTEVVTYGYFGKHKS